MKKLLPGIFLISTSLLSSAQSAITIDVKEVSSTIDPYAVGMCLSYPTDDDKYYPERVQTHGQALQAMKAKTLRFPMGTLGDNYLWTTPGTYKSVLEGLTPRVVSRIEHPGKWPEFCNEDGTLKPEVSLDFDEYMALIRQTGAKPVIMVNAFGHRLKGAEYSYEQLKTNAVEWVRYANITRKYNIKYWEIGNELSVAVTKKYITKEEYISLFNDFAAAMKAVDPSIKIGVAPGFKYFEVLNSTAELVDFVVPHQYQNNVHNYQEYRDLTDVNTNNIRMANTAIEDMPAKYRDKVEILVTEFGSTMPNGKWTLPGVSNDVSNSLVKSLYTYELMLSALKKYDRIKYMHRWVTHSPFTKRGKGDAYQNALDDQLNLTAQGKAVQFFNLFAQEQMLDVNTINGNVRAYAMYSPSSKNLSIILINKDSIKTDVKVNLMNYTGNSDSKTWEFRSLKNDPNDISPVIQQAAPVDAKKGIFTIDLPPVSVKVISFTSTK